MRLLERRVKQENFALPGPILETEGSVRQRYKRTVFSYTKQFSPSSATSLSATSTHNYTACDKTTIWKKSLGAASESRTQLCLELPLPASFYFSDTTLERVFAAKGDVMWKYLQWWVYHLILTKSHVPTAL